MSWMKAGLPKIFAGKSRRALLWPMAAKSAAALRLPLPVALADEIDCARECPVILAGRRAVAKDIAVANAKFARLAAEHARRPFDEQAPHIRAGLPHRHAAELDRLAAGGIALVRREFGVAGADRDALHRDVELVGGDLCHRRQHALAEFDAAGADGHFAGRGKCHPAIEARIVGQRAGQDGRVHCGIPGLTPSRMRAAAFSTARMIRLCAPQRQILPSSACAISSRVGDALRSSSAFAAIRMPARQ